MAARTPQDVIDRIARSTEQAGIETTRTILAGREALVARTKVRSWTGLLGRKRAFLVAAPVPAEEITFEQMRAFMGAAAGHGRRAGGWTALLFPVVVLAVAVTEDAGPDARRFARRAPTRKFWTMPQLVLADAATGEVVRPRFAYVGMPWSGSWNQLIDEHVAGAVDGQEAAA